MFANRLRNERLKKSLDVLNRTFEKRPCLVGKNLTLADITLAAQMMPLLDQDMVTICPNIKVIKLFVHIIDMNELKSVDSLYFCYWNVNVSGFARSITQPRLYFLKEVVWKCSFSCSGKRCDRYIQENKRRKSHIKGGWRCFIK